MRAGGGKQKGAQYERDVCVGLSLWISHGKKRDLFWRSAMSGGRATVARKKGVNIARHSGDVSATAPEGHALTDHYYVECKRYRDLNFGAFLTKQEGPLAKFWTKAVDEAKSYSRIPMLIIREDRNETLVLVPMEAKLDRGTTGFTYGFNPDAHLARLTRMKADLYTFDGMILKPFNVPARYKPEVFMKPGEVAHIMGGGRTKITVEKPAFGRIDKPFPEKPPAKRMVMKKPAKKAPAKKRSAKKR